MQHITKEDIKAGLQTLGVKEGYELVSLIPMGYPAKAGAAPRRREIAEFTHYEKF